MLLLLGDLHVIPLTIIVSTSFLCEQYNASRLQFNFYCDFPCWRTVAVPIGIFLSTRFILFTLTLSSKSRKMMFQYVHVLLLSDFQVLSRLRDERNFLTSCPRSAIRSLFNSQVSCAENTGDGRALACTKFHR